jgi:hypothetical protein
MNQQKHNWSTIYYAALYYTAPTCFDGIASSSECSIFCHCIYMNIKSAFFPNFSSEQLKVALHSCTKSNIFCAFSCKLKTVMCRFISRVAWYFGNRGTLWNYSWNNHLYILHIFLDRNELIKHETAYACPMYSVLRRKLGETS